jgi:hypothetical protein
VMPGPAQLHARRAIADGTEKQGNLFGGGEDH